MSTHEWVMLIAVLLGGFWTLNRQLAKIEVALSGKVGSLKGISVKTAYSSVVSTEETR